MNSILFDKLRIIYPNYPIEINKLGTMVRVTSGTQHMYYVLNANNKPILNFVRSIK